MRVKIMDANLEKGLKALSDKFGVNFSNNESIRASHTHTISTLEHQLPDCVIYVENASDVQSLVLIAQEYNLPIIAFSAGTSLEGQLNAPFGGISVDFSRMNKVIEFNPDDMTITVEPGITREVLNSWLRDSGLFFPVDPGANASIGGMASTRASGTNAVRYGTMKDLVLSAEAVMADGRLIRTASKAKKSAAGYDLTHLLVGSEGTLGLFTAITLKLQPIPEVIASGVCTFESVKHACDAVIEMIQCAVPIARVELMDQVQVAACNAYSGLDLEARPTLCLEFHGDSTSVDTQIAIFDEIAKSHGSLDFTYSRDADQRAKLWKARHNAFWAGEALMKNCEIFSTDVCVPISKLAICVEETQKDLQETGLMGPIVGHVGDGNFHLLLGYEKGNPNERAKAMAFSARLSERAIYFDGTCTGEHGIGERKAPYLRKEFGDGVDFMQVIKQALDPKNILNPGKYGFDNY
ncbi:FAD-binding protein [Bartonella sp. HY329]|uniref:FAD-binding oxidoreductase n=1 Tax=unclassified Bartonella TaxID=2645622 RepID=UPI0021C6A47E|nr:MULTISPECIES: FAD-linked oxidase C-terminal domain-containing protein [unclassified Bartonella]UXM94013.1 FAD-binding protein [Bartonella sp. HY329]UXN08335.1 FAD-binding protein [Bartonella sp. HY328]